MPLNKSGLFIFTFILLCAIDGLSQTRKAGNRNKINKSVLIDLIIDGEFYYKSFFQKFDGEELTLQSQVPELNGRIVLQKNTVLLDNFDYIRIINRKAALRNSILSGLVVGTASFFVLKEISKSEETRNLVLINQQGSNGNVEGFLAGGLGFGLGLIIYDSVFNKKMSITSERDKISRKLKDIKL